jgi:preprotein translocase subunit SecD
MLFRTLSALFLWLMMLCSLWAGAPKPTITFRIHVQMTENVGGSGPVIQVALSNPPEVITVSRSPQLAETHLQSVLPTPDGGMMVQMTSTGARLLEEATLSNPGKIMVVLLNGSVVYSPVIDMPMRSGRLMVPGPIPPELISGLQTRINQLQKK